MQTPDRTAARNFVITSIIGQTLVILIGFAQAMAAVTWERPILIVLGWGVVFGFYFLLLHSIYRGKNWARWLAFLLCASSAVFYWPSRSAIELQAELISVGAFTLNAISTVSLFVSPARRWFAHGTAA